MKAFAYGFGFLCGVVAVLATTLTGGPIGRGPLTEAIEVTRIVVVTPAVTVTPGPAFGCAVAVVTFANPDGELVQCGTQYVWRSR